MQVAPYQQQEAPSTGRWLSVSPGRKSIFWHLVDGELKAEGSLPLSERGVFLGRTPEAGWGDDDVQNAARCRRVWRTGAPAESQNCRADQHASKRGSSTASLGRTPMKQPPGKWEGPPIIDQHWLFLHRQQEEKCTTSRSTETPKRKVAFPF
jgi:hypothetical protein